MFQIPNRDCKYLFCFLFDNMLVYINLDINLHELPGDLIQSFITKYPTQSYKCLKRNMYNGNSFSASRNFPLKSYHSKHMEIRGEHNLQLRLLKKKKKRHTEFFHSWRQYWYQSNIDPKSAPNPLHFSQLSIYKNPLSVFNWIEKEKGINVLVLFNTLYSW